MKKLLIIEDDKLVGRVYTCRFELERFMVKLVEDGVAGLAAIPEFQPDAVLLDMMLPKVSGFEILRRLRAASTTKDLPVIVLSNAYLKSIEKDAMALGATLCLHKGTTTPKEIVRTLNELFESRAKTAAPVSASSKQSQSSAALEKAENDSMDRLREEFLGQSSAQIAALKKIAQGVLAATDPAKRSAELLELFASLRALSSNADLFDLKSVARLAGAMEGLLKELQDSPKSVNASAVRTVSQGVDFIGQLLSPQVRQQSVDYPPAPQIVVVDDDVISRKAVTLSLKKGRLDSVAFEHPLEALQYCGQNKLDLVILDVEMPGMNGFQLCQQLRVLPGHARTPVIFVTALTGFESRRNAAMSGGDDFIAKPFLFLELTVKALIHLVRLKVERTSSKVRGFIPSR